MRLLLLLFATWLFLASATPPRHRHKRQAGSGPSPKPILQATMNAFSSAVAMRNKAQALMVFNWPNPTTERMKILFNRWIGVSFRVVSAGYMSGNKMEGVVQAIGGVRDTTYRVILRYADESPTDWKIFAVITQNANRRGR